MNYENEGITSLGPAVSPLQESKRQQLERSKKHLLEAIADIDRTLALLDKYPETEELMDLLRRV